MNFGHARREATIRTRLDPEAIRERLSALAGEGAPRGWALFRTPGYFVGGTVGERDFTIDYRFMNRKNPQVYAVRGQVHDSGDWRVLHMTLTADRPWLHWLEIVGIVAVGCFYVFAGGASLLTAIGVTLVLIAFMAIANLLIVPGSVSRRVSSMVAASVDGSVQSGEGWRAP